MERAFTVLTTFVAMISPLIVLLSVCAIFYLILTLQMADGFPAFYEKGQDSREVEIHRMIGICFQLMVTMLLMVMSAILMPSFRAVSYTHLTLPTKA